MLLREKSRKQAIRCKDSKHMKDGWCNKHMSWCDTTYNCKVRYSKGKKSRLVNRDFYFFKEIVVPFLLRIGLIET